jgi:hypothetical protein
MKNLVLLILILCSTSFITAQTYSGCIVDKHGNNPVAGVHVSLITSNGLLVAWDYSDEKGIYKVDLPQGKQADKIHFSYLGYKKVSLSLTDFPSDGKIFLDSEDFRLQEVKVSAQRIEQKKDTLVYSVAGFSQPQDRSIADVIAKMPGMEVNPNGQISFNGKSINKFYIEGMDLMNDRYALASNNISKKRVKSVEVLQNHQPIEMLRGKSFSEQAAINLVLEDNSKMNLIGSADLGLGANKDDVLYNNRLMAMLFGKKYQTLSIYKNDNTGYDLFAEITPMTLADLTREDRMEESLVSMVSTQSPDVERSRYTFNQSHLVATNHLFRLAEKANLRTQISYFNDVPKQYNTVETEYLFTDTIGEIMHERTDFSEKRNRLDASLNVEINRPNLYVKNDLKGTFDWASAQGLTEWNEALRRLTSTPDRKFVSDVLDVKLPMPGDRHISIKSTNAYNSHPQALTIHTGDVQRLDYSSFLTHTAVSFRHRFFRMYATYQAGIRGMFQSLQADVSRQTSIEKQRFINYIPYIGTGLNYQNNSVQLSANVKLNQFRWLLKNAVETKKNTSYYPEAKLFFQYALSGTSAVDLNYQYSENWDDLRQVYDGNLFTSYRTIINNASVPENNELHRLSLRYQYNQPIKGIFYSLSASVNHTERHAAYTTVLRDGDVLFRSKQKADYDSKMYLLSTRLSQSFNWWKSLLTLQGSYMKTEDAQFSGEILQDFNIDNYMASISFSARPLSFFSFEWESAWQESRMNLGVTDSKVDHLKHQLDMYFPITNKWMLSLENTVYQSLDTNKNTWFSDISASYTHKKMEIRLDINNIFGKSSYEREFISSIERNYYRYTLRPREVLAKVSFTF